MPQAAANSEVVWAPQPGSQKLFMSCPVFEVLLGGNRGGGKTDALIMDYAQNVGQGYGQAYQGILFRRTYPQLQDVIAKSKKWFSLMWPKPHAIYNEGKSYWEWKTGERLYFRQYDKADDYYNYHGHNYVWVAWEELTNWADPTGYKRMMSTCRSTHAGIPIKYRATCNPYGPGMGWVKLRFNLPNGFNRIITNQIDADTGMVEPDRVAIESLLLENKILMDADPGYQARIAISARNEAEREAWLNNNWDIVAGGMFSDVWSKKHNAVPVFDIPRAWRVDRSFDWGSSRPFSVGWWAESNGSDVQMPDGSWRSTVRGDLFRIHEWYGWNGKPNEGTHLLAKEIAKGITERQTGNPLLKALTVRPGPADSSIYTVENGRSIGGDMRRPIRLEDGQLHRGVTWTRADKRPGSRVTGWERMRTMMKQAWPNEGGNPREHPGLFVFDTCDQFMRTVPILTRDDKNLDDINTEMEDHIADEVRYRVRYVGRKSFQTTHTGSTY